jgi:hypothetical protein
MVFISYLFATADAILAVETIFLPSAIQTRFSGKSFLRANSFVGFSPVIIGKEVLLSTRGEFSAVLLFFSRRSRVSIN